MTLQPQAINIVANLGANAHVIRKVQSTRLYPIVTSQYSSTTLYQVSYHIQ